MEGGREGGREGGNYSYSIFIFHGKIDIHLM